MTASSLYGTTQPWAGFFAVNTEIKNSYRWYLVTFYIWILSVWISLMILVRILIQLTELQRRESLEVSVSARYTRTESSEYDGDDTEVYAQQATLEFRPTYKMSLSENAIFQQLTLMDSERESLYLRGAVGPN